MRCFSTEAAQSTVVGVLTGTPLSGVVVVVVVVVVGVLTGTRLSCVVVVVIPLALCRPCLLLGGVHPWLLERLCLRSPPEGVSDVDVGLFIDAARTMPIFLCSVSGSDISRVWRRTFVASLSTCGQSVYLWSVCLLVVSLSTCGQSVYLWSVCLLLVSLPHYLWSVCLPHYLWSVCLPHYLWSVCTCGQSDYLSVYLTTCGQSVYLWLVCLLVVSLPHYLWSVCLLVVSLSTYGQSIAMIDDMIYHYVLAYDFSTARNKHVICKRERLAEVSEARVIRHVPYLHLTQ